MELGSSKVDPMHALKLRNFTAAEEVMTGGALSRPMKGLSKTKKEAEEAAAVSEAMKKAEEAAAVAEAMKKYDEATAVAEAMKKKAGEAAVVAEAMKKSGEAAAVAEAMKEEEEAMKKAEVAAAIAEAMKKKAEEVADIAVAEDSASLAEATKMEEVAAVAETVKPADAVLSSDGEDAGDFSDEEDIPSVKVHDQKTVDYILSWTYAERNPFKNLYDDDDEDYDGFVTAEEKEICAYFAEQTQGLIEFQQEARKEYEATGYITVPDDYEERYAHLQAVLRSEGIVQDA